MDLQQAGVAGPGIAGEQLGHGVEKLQRLLWAEHPQGAVLTPGIGQPVGEQLPPDAAHLPAGVVVLVAAHQVHDVGPGLLARQLALHLFHSHRSKPPNCLVWPYPITVTAPGPPRR